MQMGMNGIMQNVNLNYCGMKLETRGQTPDLKETMHFLRKNTSLILGGTFHSGGG